MLKLETKTRVCAANKEGTLERAACACCLMFMDMVCECKCLKLQPCRATLSVTLEICTRRTISDTHAPAPCSRHHCPVAATLLNKEEPKRLPEAHLSSFASAEPVSSAPFSGRPRLLPQTWSAPHLPLQHHHSMCFAPSMSSSTDTALQKQRNVPHVAGLGRARPASVSANTEDRSQWGCRHSREGQQME